MVYFFVTHRYSYFIHGTLISLQISPCSSIFVIALSTGAVAVIGGVDIFLPINV